MREFVRVATTFEKPAIQTKEQQEEQDIRRRRTPSAGIVYETIRREGEENLGRPALSLWFSGLAAGLSMSLSLVASGTLRSRLPDAPWTGLIVSLGYSVGFIVVILGRQQLFTENTLTPILPLFIKPAFRVFAQVLRLWTVVLAANIAGAAAAAAIVARTPLFGPDMQRALSAVAAEACCKPPAATFENGVMAGWIIALMVWILPAAESSRLWIIVLLTYLVSAGGFSHVIAGSVDVFYGIARGFFTWPDFWMRFFIPTLLGNVTGGLVLVAAFSYGQVAAERSAGDVPGQESSEGS
jgi:formate/nitrite transporter FocA (FNT family)